MRTRDRDGDHTEEWRASGCAAGPDTAVEAALAELHSVLDSLASLSLTGLSDDDVTRL